MKEIYKNFSFEVIREFGSMTLFKVNVKSFLLIDGSKCLIFEDLQQAVNQMSMIFYKKQDDLLKGVFFR